MNCENQEIIDKIHKDFYYDNGKRSVMSRLNTIEDKMKSYEQSIKNIDANIEELTRYSTQQQTRNEMANAGKADKKWFIGMMLTTVISLAAMILNVVL